MCVNRYMYEIKLQNEYDYQYDISINTNDLLKHIFNRA